MERRLQSRKSFMTVESLQPNEAPKYRMERWKAYDPLPEVISVQEPRESLPHGTNLSRKEWRTLNRARSGVGRTRENLHKWGYILSPSCSCGAPVQTMAHIKTNCGLGPTCTEEDLYDAKEAARRWLMCWCDKI